MFSGIMLSFAMCRDQRRTARRDTISKITPVAELRFDPGLDSTIDSTRHLTIDPEPYLKLKPALDFKSDLQTGSKNIIAPPSRFIRGVTRAMKKTYPFSKKTLDPSETSMLKSDSMVSTVVKSDSEIHSDSDVNHQWQNAYVTALLCEFERPLTYRDHSLLPRHGQDGVVAPWSPGSGVDEEVNSLIRDGSRRLLSKHNVQIYRPKDLLQRVEREPTQLAFNQVRPILHDRLQLQVPVPTLPPRDEVEHVGALSSLPSLPAGIAGEGDAQCGEDWEICSLVSHSEQSGEEVDLARDCGNRKKARSPDY